MFTTKYTKDDGFRAVVMTMLLPSPIKPTTLLDSVILVWEENKKSTLIHLLKGEK